MEFEPGTGVGVQGVSGARIGVVHGPNLRLLGRREPEVYGETTLDAIDSAVRDLGTELGAEIHTFQSNHEGAILDHLDATAPETDGYLVNAGGLTHTSVALRDGLVGIGRPFVEVHISNTSAREDFRRRSLLSPVAAGVVYGFGPVGYLLGLRGLLARLTDSFPG
jgi:3-dehydroquinate dehydratase-2